MPVACSARVDEASVRQGPRHVHEGAHLPLRGAAYVPVKHSGRKMSSSRATRCAQELDHLRLGEGIIQFPEVFHTSGDNVLEVLRQGVDTKGEDVANWSPQHSSCRLGYHNSHRILPLEHESRP
jgi:hypothetical protein